MPNDIANNMVKTIHLLEKELEEAKRLLEQAVTAMIMAVVLQIVIIANIKEIVIILNVLSGNIQMKLTSC